MLKENYKDARDKLDEILTEMEVPRFLWHYFRGLSFYIKVNKFNHPQCDEALDLIKEIRGE